MKKLLAALLAVLMLFALAACGSSEPDPNAGLYTADSASVSGITISADSAYEVFTIELKSNGKADIVIQPKDGEKQSKTMKWSLEGGSLLIEDRVESFSGTLSNGVMVLENIENSGVSVTLICPELGGVSSAPGSLIDTPAAAPAAEAPASTAQLEVGSYWSGTMTFESDNNKSEYETGTRSVIGLLDADSQGNEFFELYEVTDTEHPVLSLYVTVMGDHFVPVIGEDDAWLFNAYLDETDVDDFTLYFTNNSLRLDDYHYIVDGSGYTVSFLVSPDPTLGD